MTETRTPSKGVNETDTSDSGLERLEQTVYDTDGLYDELPSQPRNVRGIIIDLIYALRAERTRAERAEAERDSRRERKVVTEELTQEVVRLEAEVSLLREIAEAAEEHIRARATTSGDAWVTKEKMKGLLASWRSGGVKPVSRDRDDISPERVEEMERRRNG